MQRSQLWLEQNIFSCLNWRTTISSCNWSKWLTCRPKPLQDSCFFINKTHHGILVWPNHPIMLHDYVRILNISYVNNKFVLSKRLHFLYLRKQEKNLHMTHLTTISQIMACKECRFKKTCVEQNEASIIILTTCKTNNFCRFCQTCTSPTPKHSHIVE